MGCRILTIRPGASTLKCGGHANASRLSGRRPHRRHRDCFSATTPADLSGTWVATKDTPATVPAAPSAVFGERFGLRPEGKNMALIRPVRGRATALTVAFPLDGSETTVLSPSRPCMGQSGQVITMAWESDVLRYSIVGTVAPGASSHTAATPFGYRFRSMSADRLVIETTMRDAASGEIRPVGTVYQRSAEALPEDPSAPSKGAARCAGNDCAGRMDRWRLDQQHRDRQRRRTVVHRGRWRHDRHEPDASRRRHDRLRVPVHLGARWHARLHRHAQRRARPPTSR